MMDNSDESVQRAWAEVDQAQKELFQAEELLREFVRLMDKKSLLWSHELHAHAKRVRNFLNIT